MYNFYGQSDIGKVREINEDSFLGFVTKDVLFMVIADGMSCKKGLVLSSVIAINEVQRYVEKNIKKDDIDNLKLLIDQSIHIANRVVLAYKKANEVLYGNFTTTITVCAINKSKEIVIGHVGNSRLYLMRNGALTQLTKDHTEAQALLAAGKITKEELATHPERGSITNALGLFENLEIEIFGGKITDRDFVLLLTDGVFNLLTEEEISKIILEAGESKKACEWLIEGANERGGYDNAAVLMSFVNY